MEEVGHKYYPLAGFGGGDNLPLGRKLMKDFWGQAPRYAELRNILLRDGRGHPRPEWLDPDMIGAGGDWNSRARTRGGWVEEEASTEEEDKSGSLYEGPEYRASPPGS